jgi:hypothetical protein
MQALKATLETMPPGAEKTKLTEKAGEEFTWLVAQLTFCRRGSSRS